jgi:Uma2 family endonuclease
MAEPALQPHKMTFEEAAMLDPDQYPGEVVEGEWIPVTKSTWSHGKIVTKVAVALELYAREHPGWSVATGDPGTRLAHNPATLRGPDVGMAPSERDPTGRGAEGWLDGAPELAVEVCGDTQSIASLTRKALEYLRAGAQMVWLLDPDSKQLILYTPPDHVRVLQSEEVLDGGELLPGFSCRVAEFFA